MKTSSFSIRTISVLNTETVISGTVSFQSEQCNFCLRAEIVCDLCDILEILRLENTPFSYELWDILYGSALDMDNHQRTYDLHQLMAGEWELRKPIDLHFSPDFPEVPVLYPAKYYEI